MPEAETHREPEQPVAYCKHDSNCRVLSRRRAPICLSNRIMAAWMLLAILLLLCANSILLNDAARLAALPMGVFALLLLFDRNCCTHGLFLTSRNDVRLPALLLTACFFITLSIPNLLACPLFSNEGLRRVWWKYALARYAYLLWNYTGYLVGYVVAVYGCLHCALRLFLCARPAPEASAWGRIRFTGLHPSVLPLFAVLAAIVFSSYESLFIGDAPSVWYGARDCLWSEWHTAGYFLFVKLCQLIWNSQRGVVLVQSLACLYIVNYALSLYEARGLSKRAGTAYIWVVIVAFVPLYFLQAIIKDVAFSLSLLAFSLGVLRLSGDTAPRTRDWVWTGFFGLAACLFRHAGAIPVYCTLLILCIRFLVRRSKAVWRTVLCAAAIAACSTLIVQVLAYRVLQFERNPGYIMYSAPMTMIGAVADSGVEISESDKADMERIMPIEKWASCYEPYFADAISRPYGRIGDDVEKIAAQNLGGTLLRLNARFLVRYPVIYLRAFFNLNSLAWEIATPSDGYVRSYLGYVDTPISSFVAKQGYAEDGIDAIEKTLKQPETTQFSGFTALVNRYAEFLYGVPTLRSLLWRGGFANLTLAFAAVVLMKKRRAQELIGLIPVLAVTLTMLFSMPAQEVRYIFPNLLTAAFYGVYAFFLPGKE